MTWRVLLFAFVLYLRSCRWNRRTMGLWDDRRHGEWLLIPIITVAQCLASWGFVVSSDTAGMSLHGLVSFGVYNKRACYHRRSHGVSMGSGCDTGCVMSETPTQTTSRAHCERKMIRSCCCPTLKGKGGYGTTLHQDIWYAANQVCLVQKSCPAKWFYRASPFLDCTVRTSPGR